MMQEKGIELLISHDTSNMNYLTGYDAAGNEFPVVSNSEASPVAEIATDDTDFERQWVKLGSVGPQLKIQSIKGSNDISDALAVGICHFNQNKYI